MLDNLKYIIALPIMLLCAYVSLYSISFMFSWMTYGDNRCSITAQESSYVLSQYHWEHENIEGMDSAYYQELYRDLVTCSRKGYRYNTHYPNPF